MSRSAPDKSGRLHRQWADDDPVVLHPVFRGHPIPVFGDDAWDLRSLVQRSNKSVVTLHFEDLAPERKLTAKELMATRLNFPTVASRRDRAVAPYSPVTCHAMLHALRAVFGFMDERGIRGVPDLTQRDLDAFQADLPGNKTHLMSQASALHAFVWLWESRDALTLGGLSFDPWAGRSTMDVIGYVRPDENATPRVPANVMEGLLRWALAYVDLFSDDVISAERAYSADDAQPTAHGASQENFRKYVHARRRARLGLPATVHIGEVKACRSLIAKEARVNPGWFASPVGRIALKDAWDDLGPEMRCLGAPRRVLDGQTEPWRAPMTIEEMKDECRYLVAAAYVVVAYLSGMRDSEVQDLRRRCVEVERDEFGEVVRYRVRGRTFKNERVPQERTWVVIEPVARAIAVLERLTGPQSAKTGDDRLFVRLYLDSAAGPVIKAPINGLLRVWAAHCNTVLAPRMRDVPGDDIVESDAPGRLRPIPAGPDGEPWHLSTSQFRRTLAWFIANQPFGEIAGMIQYGHCSTQMFEGYAGTLESGFRAEVVSESLMARLDDLVEMAEEATRGVDPAGPMAGELKAIFGEAFRMPDFPGEVVGEQRLRMLARNKASTLRLGALAHCFFVPARAVCLDHLDLSKRKEPVTGLCDPDCANACWTKDHLPTWASVLDDASMLLKGNRLSGPQREELSNRARQARAKIGAIEEARRGQIE